MYEITFPGGVAVDVAMNGHTIHTDQPVAIGGGDSAPTPFQLFLASIATCAGFYALRFCQERHIPTEGLSVTMATERDAAVPNKITAVRLGITTPAGFPEKYREAIVRAVDHCAVKRAIAEPPAFEVKVA
jgi:putative redox protein